MVILQNKIFLAYFQKISIIFQILVKNSEISLKIPQVQEAAIHTYENQWIKVGGVLKTFWIDLMIPINFIICNFYLYLDKFGQSWVKFHFFWFYKFWMQTVFLGIIWFFFVKLGFFPLFLVHFLYGKNTKYWKIIAEMSMKTVCMFP